MAIFTGVGSPGTVSLASGGLIAAINTLTTTPLTILGLDPSRKRIVVHNPGSIDAFICPVYDQNTGTDVATTPSPTSLGGCFLIFANGGTLILEGEIQKPWYAFSRSGSNNPLTVMVSRI